MCEEGSLRGTTLDGGRVEREVQEGEGRGCCFVRMVYLGVMEW